LEEIEAVLKSFDPKEASSIKKTQDCLAMPSLKANLAFIHAHLSFLPGVIKSYEEGGLELTKGLETLAKTKQRINSIPGSMGEILKKKLSAVLANNPDLDIIEKLGNALKGEGGELPNGIAANVAADMKYCPLSSADVERSFSVYKSIFTER